MENMVTDSVSDDSAKLLPQLLAFLAVVDAGGFTAAARRCTTDKTIISRRVKALEAALGVRLLNRTTRAVHVTAAGQRLADEARGPIAAALLALNRTRPIGELWGTVRIASTPSLAQEVLVPMLGQLRLAHPNLKVELNTNETLTPLVEHGYDLALRVGRLPDSSLILRKLATWRYLLVASPSWAKAHPDLKSPRDLLPHWLQWGSAANAQQWSFQRGDDVLDLAFVDAPLVYGASQLLVESARAGLGMAAVPPFCVARELAEGSLVRILPEWRIRHELGIFAVTPHRTMQPDKVQIVLEAARNKLADLAPKWWELTA